jgi:hypothetical protein
VETGARMSGKTCSTHSWARSNGGDWIFNEHCLKSRDFLMEILNSSNPPSIQQPLRDRRFLALPRGSISLGTSQIYLYSLIYIHIYIHTHVYIYIYLDILINIFVNQCRCIYAYANVSLKSSFEPWWGLCQYGYGSKTTHQQHGDVELLQIIKELLTWISIPSSKFWSFKQRIHIDLTSKIFEVPDVWSLKSRDFLVLPGGWAGFGLAGGDQGGAVPAVI